MLTIIRSVPELTRPLSNDEQTVHPYISKIINRMIGYPLSFDQNWITEAGVNNLYSQVSVIQTASQSGYCYNFLHKEHCQNQCLWNPRFFPWASYKDHSSNYLPPIRMVHVPERGFGLHVDQPWLRASRKRCFEKSPLVGLEPTTTNLKG